MSTMNLTPPGFAGRHSLSHPKGTLGNSWKLLIMRKSSVYSCGMAKRKTGVGKMKQSRSRKTKKRLEAKKEMLAKKMAKRRKK